MLSVDSAVLEFAAYECVCVRWHVVSNSVSETQGCRVLVFYVTPTPGLENLGLQTSTLTPAIKKTWTLTPDPTSDSDSSTYCVT